MKALPLTKGFVALVDDDSDADQFKWTAVTPNKGKPPYAYRRTGWDRVRNRWTRTIYLHRYVLDAPDGVDVDHINGDPLDNRRENLRVASRSENLANTRRKHNGVGYRGVTRANQKAGFAARCGEHLGTFETAEAAARAYDAAALKKFGEFAKLNFRNGAEPNSACDDVMKA